MLLGNNFFESRDMFSGSIKEIERFVKKNQKLLPKFSELTPTRKKKVPLIIQKLFQEQESPSRVLVGREAFELAIRAIDFAYKDMVSIFKD